VFRHRDWTTVPTPPDERDPVRRPLPHRSPEARGDDLLQAEGRLDAVSLLRRLTPRQRKLVILIAEHGVAGAAELAPFLAGCSPETFYRELRAIRASFGSTS
jgi:hypothetical protein